MCLSGFFGTFTDLCGYRFNYEPSLVISVLAVAIFSIALVLYVWQVVRYRTWWLIIMVWAVVVETAGYVLRMIVSCKCAAHTRLNPREHKILAILRDWLYR